MRRISFQLVTMIFACCVLATAQTPQNYSQDNVSFDYSQGWTLVDDTNKDALQFTLSKANSDVQIRGFIHKGRISADKLPEAKQKFIDPYIQATAKQFVQMGAKPEQSPDTTEIGGVKAEGVTITASLAGETGATKIYWALIGQRVVMLTLFGPDKQLKELASAWDLVRTTLKITAPKAAPKPSPSP